MTKLNQIKKVLKSLGMISTTDHYRADREDLVWLGRTADTFYINSGALDDADLPRNGASIDDYTASCDLQSEQVAAALVAAGLAPFSAVDFHMGIRATQFVCRSLGQVAV